MNHVPDRMLAEYLAGGALPGDQEWAMEAHLETCAQCRARLSGAPTMAESGLLDAVWAGLEPRLAGQPAPRCHRVRAWLHRWATPAMVPWLAMVAVVLAITVILDRMGDGSRSLLQLFAPVLPVFGVAAAWSRGLDPAYELTAGSPRAGLELVLRRSAAVLLPLVAILLPAGWFTGANLGLVLLPALGFSTGTLALGSLIGVGWAASILSGVWLGALVVPAMSMDDSVALEPAALPYWIALVVLTAGFVVFRKDTFMRLAATR
ncbi:zf-HC2 domain-containing protein [Amycolatopsis sulphurea]|uniref:zf-HC2 domain-containing protein n=1 Tax=Amycolatopsis sulphurea TaxID=76022 RepID=UPI000BF640B1|nr:zf-HC2 domain-containing protein [Amycolatopsis sulphurea]